MSGLEEGGGSWKKLPPMGTTARKKFGKMNVNETACILGKEIRDRIEKMGRLAREGWKAVVRGW